MNISGETDSLLIVGLGNIGLKYRNTRHNMGFMALEHLLNKWGIKCEREKFYSLFAESRYQGRKIFFLLPSTYMNNSGKAVKACADFYRIAPNNILVIYDDIDLKFGQMRWRLKGSAGTHNGMRSVVSELNTDNFMRLRLGIGPKHPYMNLADYVLSNIDVSDSLILRKVLFNSSLLIEKFLESGYEKTQTFLNVLNKELEVNE